MNDYEGFDFDNTQREAWEDFASRLDEVLSVMDSSADLTISVATTAESREVHPGIRFTIGDDDVIWAYVTGSDGGEPTKQEERGLVEFGWTPPTETSPRFCTSVVQESSGTLARLASDTLASVFGVLHPIFLEPDQLAEILKGEAEWTPLTPRPLERDECPVLPASKADLDLLVDSELRRIFGHPPLRNEQGDVAIRVGSAMVFLRSTDDAKELVLFSPLVHNVQGRSRACEVLNDLNVESRFGRFALHRDRVYVQVSVAAQPFVPMHLQQGLRAVSQIADGIDEALADKLGGRTTFQAT